MYMNTFLAMDFTDDGYGVVFHFLNGVGIAEEYLFEQPEDASKFYLMCLRFFAEFEEERPAHQQKLFRDFLESDMIKMKFIKRIY